MGYVRRPAGWGVSTELPDMDFETYSEADLTEVGAANYSLHPSTEILSLAYNLKDGTGAHLWVPGALLPWDLFNHFASGGLIEAWNVAFEQWVWNNVGTRKYMFPPINPDQLRCAMGKSRAWGLPGKLAKAGDIIKTMEHLA